MAGKYRVFFILDSEVYGKNIYADDKEDAVVWFRKLVSYDAPIINVELVYDAKRRNRNENSQGNRMEQGG